MASELLTGRAVKNAVLAKQHHQRVSFADERPSEHLRPSGVLSTASQGGAPKPEQESSFKAEGCFHSSCNRLLGGNWSTGADDAIDHADESASIRLQKESRQRELATANSDQNINSSGPAFVSVEEAR